MVLRVKYINFDIIGIYTYYLIIKKPHVNRYLIFYYVFSDQCCDIYTHLLTIFFQSYCMKSFVRDKLGTRAVRFFPPYIYIYTL